MNFQELTVLIKDWVIIIATSAGVFFGLKELSKWRIETLGRDRYSIAKKIASKVYELEKAITSLRSFGHVDPGLLQTLKHIFGGEDKDYVTGGIEKYKGKQELMSECMELFRELRELNLEAKLYGADFGDEISSFMKHLTEMQVWLTLIVRGLNDQVDQNPNMKQFVDALNGTALDEYGKQIQNTVSAAIAKVTRELKKA